MSIVICCHPLPRRVTCNSWKRDGWAKCGNCVASCEILQQKSQWYTVICITRLTWHLSNWEESQERKSWFLSGTNKHGKWLVQLENFFRKVWHTVNNGNNSVICQLFSFKLSAVWWEARTMRQYLVHEICEYRCWLLMGVNWNTFCSTFLVTALLNNITLFNCGLFLVFFLENLLTTRIKSIQNCDLKLHIIGSSLLYVIDC